MTGEVIKEFLVGLGFGVDDSSLKKFNAAIDNAYKRVGLIAAAVTASAAGVFAGISQISDGFEQMGYEYRIIAPMLNRTLMLRQALLKAYGQAGINITKAVQQSVIFNYSLAKTKFQLEGIYKSVGMRFLPMLTKQMDIFRGKVIANMPAILKFLDGLVKLVFKSFEAISILGVRLWSILTRVWEVFKKLDESTNGWSTKILGFIAVWKLLNLAFLTTPLGMIFAGIVALIALYDDFKVWQEGGESLIDWGSDLVKMLLNLAQVIGVVIASIYSFNLVMRIWAAGVALVQGAISVFTGVLASFRAIMAVVRTAILLFNLALYANPIGLVIAAVVALGAAAYALVRYWEPVKKWFSELFAGLKEGFGLISKVGSFFGGNSDVNINRNLTTTPLGSSGSSSNSNVNQVNNITVTGATDPQQTASTISSAQNRVNSDLVRNFKGAAK